MNTCWTVMGRVGMLKCNRLRTGTRPELRVGENPLAKVASCF